MFLWTGYIQNLHPEQVAEGIEVHLQNRIKYMVYFTYSLLT